MLFVDGGSDLDIVKPILKLKDAVGRRIRQFELMRVVERTLQQKMNRILNS